VDAPGFKRLVRSGLVLDVDQNAQLDLALDVGSTAQMVHVNSAEPLLETQSSDIGQVIGTMSIENLPLAGDEWSRTNPAERNAHHPIRDREWAARQRFHPRSFAGPGRQHVGGYGWRLDGMPRSAIESGCIDFVMSPEKIAAELAWMSTHPNLRRRAKGYARVFDSILKMVSTSQGADFTKYKPNAIHRRTQQRMAGLRIANLAAYLSYLGEHPEEVAKLTNHVLIPETEFFRNPEVFEDLANTVYPAIVGDTSTGTLRIWVVACSSGEELYSMAITVLEFFGCQGR
jgi:hypothetical protein